MKALWYFVGAAALAQDPESPQGRGHREATLFYQTPSVSYYLTQIPSTVPNALFDALIAVHTAPQAESDAFLPLESVQVTYSNGSTFPGSRYTDAYLQDFRSNVFPALAQKEPRLARMIRATTLHYVKGLHLADLPNFARARKLRTPNVTYEQPVAITELERGSSGDPWRPQYEQYKVAGDGDQESFYRVADARKARSEPRTAPTVQLSAKQKEAREHMERQVALAAARESQRRLQGIVYRSATFWRQFSEFQIPRMVFNGDGVSIAEVPPVTKAIRSNTVDTARLGEVARFQNHFNSYVRSFHQYCHDFLPPTFTRAKGTRSSDPGGPPDIVDMDARFFPKFKQFGEASRAQAGALVFETLGEVLRNTKASLSDVAMRNANRALSGLAAWDAFFDKVPCHSATMRQMGENLLLAANGEGSMQSGKGPERTSRALIAQAAQESEPYTVADYLADPDTPELKRQITAALAEQTAGRGLPLRREEVEAFRSWKFAPGAPNVEALERDGVNVLVCHYGPIAIGRDGKPTYRDLTFWYRQTPAGLPGADARFPRSLRQSVAVCPATSAAAEALEAR